jgi:spore coat protein CotF
MQEKDMVNDALASVKHSLSGYAGYITETSNQQLRQTLQDIRNGDEVCHYDLFKLAEQKGFYKPAQTAELKDVQQIKAQFCSSGTRGS